jgi:hypothetical protein
MSSNVVSNGSLKRHSVTKRTAGYNLIMPSRFSSTKDALLRFLANNEQYNPQLISGSLPSGLAEYAAGLGVSISQQNRGDNILVHQAFWALVGNGLAMPGSRNGQDNNLPFICITDYGLACVQEDRQLPIDSEGFLEGMDLDAIDDIIRLYVEEAVGTFSNRNYLAACVMAGSALERAILVMTQEYLQKIPGPMKAAYEKEVLSAQKIKTRFDNFLEFIDSNGLKKALPRATQETLDSLFPAIVNLIRITRNDVGHPTGREVERDEAEALIYLLKSAIKFVYAFI